MEMESVHSLLAEAARSYRAGDAALPTRVYEVVGTHVLFRQRIDGQLKEVRVESRRGVGQPARETWWVRARDEDGRGVTGGPCDTLPAALADADWQEFDRD